MGVLRESKSMSFTDSGEEQTLLIPRLISITEALMAQFTNMSSTESLENVRAVIGLIVLFSAILWRLGSPRFTPYINYVGLVLLAIAFLVITGIFLPQSWMIWPAAGAVLIFYAFVQAFSKLR